MNTDNNVQYKYTTCAVCGADNPRYIWGASMEGHEVYKCHRCGDTALLKPPVLIPNFPGFKGKEKCGGKNDK